MVNGQPDQEESAMFSPTPANRTHEQAMPFNRQTVQLGFGTNSSFVKAGPNFSEEPIIRKILRGDQLHVKKNVNRREPPGRDPGGYDFRGQS